MGVLKVNVGDAVTPDWRNIGCGDPPPVISVFFADNFNRSNGALSAPWDTSYGTGSWAVSSSELAAPSGVPGGGSASGFALAVVDTGEETADVQADLTAMSTVGSGYTGSGGLVWNVVDSNNYYLWHINTSSSSVYQVVSGSLNPIAALSGPNNGVSGTGTYRVVHDVSGQISLYKNGAFLVSNTGFALTSGATFAGVASNDTGNVLRIDNVILSLLVPGTGRLKLWDGTQWMREACSSELASSQVIPDATLNPTLPSHVYNGDRATTDWTNLGNGTVNVTIDLGSSVALDRVNWLLYYGDSRTYSNLGLDGSNDGSTWTTIRSPANFQPSTTGSAGLDISVGASYRYLRFHGEGQNVNGNNEWVEIEIYRTPDPTWHPLKLWDGTTWQTVCCMTPV